MQSHTNAEKSGALASAPYVGASMERWVIPFVLMTLLSGCGLKGGLYLPDRATPVVITPASSSSASSSSSAPQQVTP